MPFCIIHNQTSFWRAWDIIHKNAPMCSTMLWKGKNWKFIFPWKVINSHILEMAEAHFWSTIWFVISEKIITIFKVSRGEYVHQNSKLDTQNCALVFLILSTLKLPLYGLVVLNDANSYILKEDRIFKAF